MKRWMLVCFATLSLLVLAAGAVASPAAAAPGGNADNAHACQKGGWETLARAEDRYTAFANQDECVSYGAQGGTIVDLVVLNPYISLTFSPTGSPDYCGVNVHLREFQPNTEYVVSNYAQGSYWGSTTISTDGDGNADYAPYTYVQLSVGPFAQAIANNGIDSGLVEISC